MPQLGESIAEATIINFLVKAGDTVAADQDVIEVETNKATMNVAAPCPGKSKAFSAKLNESYPVGAVLGSSRSQQGRRGAPRIGWSRTDRRREKSDTANGEGSGAGQSRRPNNIASNPRCAVCPCRPAWAAPATCRRA